MILRNTIACFAVVWAVSVLADDALTNAVDPYDQADQKVKFIKAAGNNGELDQKKFLADQKTGGDPKAGAGLILPFEKWETAVAFDKNKNGSLDWFEFEAYRQAMRVAVLAAFDKNKDGKLTGDERTAALKALQDGKVTIKPAPETPRGGALPPTPGGTAASQPTSQPTSRPARVPLETSGLSDAQIRHIKELIPDAVAVDTRLLDKKACIVYSGDNVMRAVDLSDVPGDDPWGENKPTRPPRDSLPLETSGLSDKSIRFIKEKYPNAVAVDMRNTSRSADRKYLTVSLYCDDGKTRAVFMPGTPEEIGKIHLKTLPAPFGEFILRQFDAGGNGKLSDEEWKACEMFDGNLTETMTGWIWMVYDKDTPGDERDEALQAIGAIMDQATNQRAGRDVMTPMMNGEDDEEVLAFWDKVNGGMVRYMERFEKRALADNGGKPGAATRAALLKAIDADMRDRAKRIGMNNGKLTPENSGKLFLELLDEWLKDE